MGLGIAGVLMGLRSMALVEPMRYAVRRGNPFPFLTVQPEAVMPPERCIPGTVLRDHWVHPVLDGAVEGTETYRATRYEHWLSMDIFIGHHFRRFLVLAASGHTFTALYDATRDLFLFYEPGDGAIHSSAPASSLAAWRHLEDISEWQQRCSPKKERAYG
ncbi:hypothetical protein EVB27_035 [Rhizobium phage RHph_TM16]|nr:hypothetical protein EVB27_035 [Rhizobium phage RHph_TM16]